MAGQRRGTGRPTQHARRTVRRRELLTRRLAEAKTPADRLGAAYAYARAALTDMPPAEAARAADELVRALTGIGK